MSNEPQARAFFPSKSIFKLSIKKSVVSSSLSLLQCILGKWIRECLGEDSFECAGKRSKIETSKRNSLALKAFLHFRVCSYRWAETVKKLRHLIPV